MVREYSAGGPQSPQEAGDSTSQPPLDLRGGAVNLTQELAQLLAASIAQNQPGKRLPGATGSELASLAALVASPTQRSLGPSFKDGLSSLSYAPPAVSPPTSGGLLINEHQDDEPMPIPSTWRQPVGSDDERWYRQQVGAAALGLVAGLIVVVPSVLWLSGWMGGARTSARQAGSEPIAVKVAEVKSTSDIRAVKVQVVPVEKTETATQYVAASVDPRLAMAPTAPAIEQAPVPIPVPVARTVEPKQPRADEVITQVERRIGSGDIAGAREMILANETAAPGAMIFALAETYDPNMLAAWGTRGVSADVVKARSLYQRARDLGEARAQMRLDQLK